MTFQIHFVYFQKMSNNRLADVLKGMKTGDVDVSLLSADTSPCVVNEWLTTGSLALDAILGGGLPVGRITEVYGDTSTGKSLLAAQVVALAQEQGYIAIMVDTESAVSLPIMEAVGVDTEKLIYTAPDTVEEVFQIFDSAIESKKLHDPDNLLLLVWDSIAATSAMAEMTSDYGKAMMGKHAQLISQGLRKIARKISKQRVCALFLNQTRQKIGVMFGDDEATFGGKAVSFYSSVRVRLKKGKKIKSGKRIVGIETVASVVKNKVAVPFREATLPIYFGHGVDDAGAAFNFMKAEDLFQQNGAWYIIELGGKEVKFQQKGWDDIFDEHYDEIADIILEPED